MKAANDAQASAQIAQNNAAEAGAKASITSLHDIHSSIPSHGSTSYQQVIDHDHDSSSQYGSESAQHKTIAVPNKQEAAANSHPQQSKAQNNQVQQSQNKPQQIKPQHNQPHHNQPQHNQPQHNQPQQSQNKPQHGQSQQNKTPSKDSAPNASTVNVKQIETIASNHNYGNTEFRPSKQYSFAGY